MIRGVFFFLFSTFLLVCPSLSQEIGGLATPNGNVWLRDKAPSWPLFTKGKEIGVIEKGSEVKVLERKSLNFVFKSYDWLRVELKDRDGNVVQGWVYDGEANKPRIFEPLRAE